MNHSWLGRNRGRIVAVAAIVGVLLSGQIAAAQRPSAAKLLPENTILFLSVADAQDMAARFKNTAMGRMSEDPQLKPLVKDLYGTITDAVANLKEEVGLSLPEILDIPQGEMTLAIVPPDEGPPAAVVLLDAGDQLSNAQRLLKRGTDELEKQPNVKKSEETISGTTVTVYDGLGPRGRKAMYFVKDATLVLGSDMEVLKRLLAAWTSGQEKSLADNEKFAAIMRRSRGAKDQEPQFFWFFDPIALMKKLGQDNVQIRMATAALPALGLDGVLGLGGSLALDAGQFDSVAHFHLLLDNPRDGIVEMIAFEPGDVRPEAWVPADVASYTTFHWRFQTTFNNLARIFDSFQGQGALSGNIRRAVTEPTGIDLEKDLLPNLDGRVTYFTRIDRDSPVSLQSNTWCWALKLKDAKPVEEALETLAKKYEQNVRQETFAGTKYYQAIPPQPRRVRAELESRADQAALNEARRVRAQIERRVGDVPRPKPDDPDLPRPPEPCFAVVKNCLVFTDRASTCQMVISLADNPKESLADALDFKLIAAKIARAAGGNKPAMISFNRPEEAMRWAYDMVNAERTRARLREAAETNPFFKNVETVLEKNPLPPFEVLQQYLAPGGAMVIDDETGIHYTAFTLRRKSE